MRSWQDTRERCPVAWTERDGGYWVISGYEEVAAAFRDWEHFSSARTNPEFSSIVLGQQPAAAADAGGDRPARVVPVAAHPLRAARAAGRRAPPPACAPLDDPLRRPVHRARRVRVHPRRSRCRCPARSRSSGSDSRRPIGGMIADAFHDVAAHSHHTPEYRTAQARVRQRDDADQGGGRSTRALAARRRDDRDRPPRDRRCADPTRDRRVDRVHDRGRGRRHDDRAHRRRASCTSRRCPTTSAV